MVRRLLVPLTLVLTLALSLTGCGGGDKEPTPEPTAVSAPATSAPATSAPATSVPATAAPAPTAPEPTRVPVASVPTAAQPTAAQPTAAQPTAAQPTATQPAAGQPTAAPTDAPDPTDAPGPGAKATAAPGKPAPTAGPATSAGGEAEPEVEPNDDAAQATAITAGAWEGALSDGDTDWYSLDVPAGAVADIALTAGSSAGGLQVLVYDAKNAHLWDDTAGTDQTVSFRRIEGAGGALRIEVRGGPGDYRLQAAIAAQDDAGSGGDAGDDLANATEIDGTATAEGLIGGEDAHDCYTFDVPDGSTIELAFTPGQGAEEMAARLLDPDQVELWGEYSIGARGSGVRWVVSGEDGGPYYVEVHYGRGTYTVDLATTPQNDGGTGADAPGEYRDAVKVTGKEPLAGVVGNTDREDWYLFSVDPGIVLTVNVAVDPESDQINAWLYDPDESEIWSEYDISPRQGASVTHLISAEAAGEYFLGFGGTGVYTATIAIAEQNDAGSGGDSGEEIQDAVEVEVGEPFDGLQGDTDYADWYAFDVPGGSVLTVSVTPDRDTEGLSFSLVDVDESELWSEYDVRGGRAMAGSFILGPESGGTHYLQVFGGQGAYSVEIAVSAQDDADSGGDAGDEIQDAVEIEVGEEYIGLQGGSDWTDWYVVTLEEGQSVTVILTPDRGDQRLYYTVYDVDENEIESVYDVTNSQPGEVAIEDAVAGEYYIEIHGGEGGYTLTVEE